ncbi:hypothetical protein [Collinsella phocaeensis]|uniref:hypothetical protein n=1 Tax=Collinsella phocaeensis TaxID=1871016 RepID=UPI000AF050E7|nr:hypothetical protein [Collinsella phocaeensis]
MSSMEKILCDISALRYYRTPPRYLYALPEICDFDTPYGRSKLHEDLVASSILGIPIHALSLGGERLTSTLVHQHFRTKRIPPDGIVDTPFGVSVTSPLFTLLMLAGKLDPIELALLIYEFAGTFTSSAMDPRLAREIECSVSKDQLNGLDEWQVVDTGSKERNDLWSRPPLMALDNIMEFLELDTSARGARRLRRAMRYVTGCVASPFEAKASILLGAPRKLGGEGLSGLQNNLPIALDNDARRICGKHTVYGDIVWEKTREHPAVILECQGAIVHDSIASAQADDDRALALEQMGYQVVRITYKQIADEARFQLLAKHLADLLHITKRPPSFQTAQRQALMRERLFGPWPFCDS